MSKCPGYLDELAIQHEVTLNVAMLKLHKRGQQCDSNMKVVGGLGQKKKKVAGKSPLGFRRCGLYQVFQGIACESEHCSTPCISCSITLG